MIRRAEGPQRASRATLQYILAVLACTALLAANRAVTVLPRASLGAFGATFDAWSADVSMQVAGAAESVRRARAVYVENDRLSRENRLLGEQLAQLRSLQAENAVLRRELDFDRSFGHHMLTVAVIGRSPDPFQRTLVIDRGSGSGVRTGMVVVAGAAIVGKVTACDAGSATVQSVVDPSSRVNGLGADSGVTGTVIGDGNTLDVETDSSFGPGLTDGEWLLTSGLGGTYPRGLVIGQVVQVQKRDSATAQSAHVVPAAAPETLTAVQVVLDFSAP